MLTLTWGAARLDTSKAQKPIFATGSVMPTVAVAPVATTVVQPHLQTLSPVVVTPATQSVEEQAQAALIEQAKIGDQQAFATLVELHQDHVYNLAYRILQNPEEADDATQEVFVKVWQALASFRGDAKFTTWLFRIVHNHCLNKLRSVKNAPKTVSTQTSLNEGDDEEHDLLANLPGDQSDEPSFQFENRERCKLIWQQVELLPPKYRSIITLYYLQEFSYEEIASVLDMPVGTVKTHLYRAKALLKARLGELKTMGVLEII